MDFARLHANFRIQLLQAETDHPMLGTQVNWGIWDRTPESDEQTEGVLMPLARGASYSEGRTSARRRAEESALKSIVTWLAQDERRACTIEVVWQPLGILSARGTVDV